MQGRFAVLIAIAASWGAGCGLQGSNSFSLSDDTSGDVSDVEIKDAGDERFAAALSVIRENCTSCHTHVHGFDSFSSEDEFINSYYVVQGSPAGSALYTRIRGAEFDGIGDMPPDSELPEADLAVIREWIERIGEEDEAATGDGSGGGGTDGSTKAGRLAVALAVISSRCASCHGGVKTAASSGASGYLGQAVGAFATFTTDQEFVASGLVDYGNPETSWILRALSGYGDIGTMPESGAPLDAEDYADLSAWIEGMDD